jgi:hypothetical protein
MVVCFYESEACTMADSRDLKERWKAIRKLCDAELEKAPKGRKALQWTKAQQTIDALLGSLDEVIPMESAAAKAWKVARGIDVDTDKPMLKLVKC